MGNGFYGKLAQGIEYRTVYDLDGKKVQLDPSVVTNPIYAAPTTSISRCVIAVMVNEINKWPGCKVFNATTDGMTISVPKPKWWNIEVWKKGEKYNGKILSLDNIEDKKRKEKITIEKVIFRKNSQTQEGTLRIQGSRIKTIMRVTLSAMWKFDWIEKKLSTGELIDNLNKIILEEKLNTSNAKRLISENDLKNWKRRNFLPKSLPNNKKVREIVEKIAQILQFEMDEKRFEKILNN